MIPVIINDFVIFMINFLMTFPRVVLIGSQSLGQRKNFGKVALWVGEPHQKDVGLEDAVAFLDQGFELLDQRNFNSRRNRVMISKQWYGERINWGIVKGSALNQFIQTLYTL